MEADMCIPEAEFSVFQMKAKFRASVPHQASLRHKRLEQLPMEYQAGLGREGVQVDEEIAAGERVHTILQMDSSGVGVGAISYV